MAESYQDKLDNFSRGKSFVKLRGGVRNSKGEPCDACGSGQPGTLFGIRELLTGLDHFVGYNCLRELMRKKVVLQGRVREATEEAFSRARQSRERSGNGQFGQARDGNQAGERKTLPQQGEREATSAPPSPGEGTPGALPLDVPVVATPNLVVWETEDAFRAAVHVHGQSGLAGVWGAAEQPKWRQLLVLERDDGFLLTKEEQYDRAALARCVRLATQNAYLTLHSQLARPGAEGSKVATAEGASSGEARTAGESSGQGPRRQGGEAGRPGALSGQEPNVRAGELLRAMGESLGPCALHLPGVHLSRGLQTR